MSNSNQSEATEKKLFIVLEQAFLETVYVSKQYELLNCDDHQSVLKKHKIDVNDARPDITHQCLLNLLDSPLNKAELLQIYIRTRKNVLIKINPLTKIPRTFKRFAGLMVQLLHEHKVKAVTADGSQTLLKVLKNDIVSQLPIGCKKIGTSKNAPLVQLDDWVKTLEKPDEPIVFVIGAISNGEINPEFTEDKLAISNYPLSAAVCCTKVCSAFEKLWGIL